MIELLVRLAVSMAVVMGVMALAAHLVRRRQGGLPGGGLPLGEASMSSAGRARGTWGGGKARKGRPSAPVDIVYRRALAKGACVTVVEAGGRRYLVGVTEQTVNLLAELPDATGAVAPAKPAPASHTGEVTAEVPLALDLENWPQGGTPGWTESAATGGRSDNAWKLALDSLRERTVRR